MHSLFEFVSFRIVSCLHSFRVGPVHIVCIRYISCLSHIIYIAYYVYIHVKLYLFAFVSVLFGWVRSFHIVWFRFGSLRSIVCIRCLNVFRFGSFHICIRFVSLRFTLFEFVTFRVGSVRFFAFVSVLFGWVLSFRIVWFRFNIHLDIVLYDSNKLNSIQSKYYLHIFRFGSERFVLFALVRVRVSIVCIRLLVPAV